MFARCALLFARKSPCPAPVARMLPVNSSSVVAHSPLRLDPPGTAIPGEATCLGALSGVPGSNNHGIEYRCDNCELPLFSAEHFSETSKPCAHSSGWPTFVDHYHNSVVIKSILSNKVIAAPDAAQKIPVTVSRASGMRKSFTLRGAVSDSLLNVGLAPAGSSSEDQISMRQGARVVQNRFPNSDNKRFSSIIVCAKPSRAQMALKEERRKLVLGHFQGHCQRCQTPVALVTPGSKRAPTRMVVNPSAVFAARPRRMGAQSASTPKNSPRKK